MFILLYRENIVVCFEYHLSQIFAVSYIFILSSNKRYNPNY